MPCLISPQDAVVLRHDGTVTPLHLARKSGPPPGPRYSHAMVSVPAEDNNSDGKQLAFLFGGCRGDGTRAAGEEAFVLDLASGGAGGGGNGDEDEKTNDEAVDCEDAQVGLNHELVHKHTPTHGPLGNISRSKPFTLYASFGFLVLEGMC